MCFLDIRTTFLCLCFLSLMTFGAGTQSETQKQPTGESFEKAIADRELLRGYFSVYKGKKDLRGGDVVGTFRIPNLLPVRLSI